jgi:hypothetical protein
LDSTASPFHEGSDLFTFDPTDKPENPLTFIRSVDFHELWAVLDSTASPLHGGNDLLTAELVKEFRSHLILDRPSSESYPTQIKEINGTPRE